MRGPIPGPLRGRAENREGLKGSINVKASLRAHGGFPRNIVLRFREINSPERIGVCTSQRKK